MFCFLCKSSFLHGRQTITATASQSYKLLYILQRDPSVFRLSSSVRFISTTNTSNQQSFTVSYLINKCGFSPETASWASMYVHFKTPEKPDSLIAFLENHGFSKTQITDLIRRQPDLLVSDTEKTLLPKLEFFHSIGFSRPDLTKLLSNYPAVLKSSLEKQIIPSYNFLRNLFQSNDKTIKAIKRFTGVLVYSFESHLFPNIKILRRNGVPESNIIAIFHRKPRTFMFNPVRFKEVVEEVKRMGIPSDRKKFLEAIFALRSMSKSTLENKFAVYRRWAWSDQEILEAFRKYPTCMTVSEEKIMAIMNFLVNKMGYSTTLVAKQPSILHRSLKRRIVPRALFAQELLSQGLITDIKLSVLFDTTEEVFLKRFVNRHADRAPELLKLYEEKQNTSEKMKMAPKLNIVVTRRIEFGLLFCSSINFLQALPRYNATWIWRSILTVYRVSVPMNQKELI
ncbi:hypothetical protein PTKIN_Ptkin09bG0023300 [Pterospermum kingtungense]